MGRGAAVLALWGLAASCAAAPRPQAAAEVVAGEGRQTLLRVHYDGPAGEGGLRLVLRRATAARFQLDASDLLGRPLWSLRGDEDRLTLADHRERIFCEGAERIAVPDPVLAELTAEDLSRALEGSLPVPPPVAPPTRGKLDFRDAKGRRWTASYDAGRLVSWTLWGESPAMWWLAVDDGGILSHRDGSQFRWRQTASEPLAADWLPADTPADYEAGTCEIQ